MSFSIGEAVVEGGTFGKFALDLRGGLVSSVEDHPIDENLYVISVDIGKQQKRQAVARLRKIYPSKEELLHRQVVILCNLPPVGKFSDGVSSLVTDECLLTVFRSLRIPRSEK